MNHDLAITLAILAVAVVLLVSDRVRPDAVALLAAASLAVTGVLTPQMAFSGFGSRAVITVLAVGILAEGLRVSGTADRVGAVLLKVSGPSEGRLVAATMVVGAIVSLFMNNIAAAAVLLPAVAAATRRAGLAPSRIMMPLAFGTVLGGMATLLTSSNLIVGDLLAQGGHGGFGLFDFAPVGIPLVLAGTVYMLVWGRRRLPVGGPEVPDRGPNRDDLPDVYRLDERTRQARLKAGAPIVGHTLAESGIRERLGLSVTAVSRGATLITTPTAGLRLEAGDVLQLMGRISDDTADLLAEWFEPVTEGATASPGRRETVMAEAVLPPRSPMQGSTLRDVRFGDRFGMTVLAVWRGDRPIRSGLGDLELAMGDALLLQGPARRLDRLRRGDDLIILGGPAPEPRSTPGRARAAVLILLTALALGAWAPQAIGAIFLIGALAMVFLGLLTMDRAHQAIDWRTIFLVAGMLPLGIALQETGAAALVADGIVRPLGPLGPTALLGGVFFSAALLTQAIIGPAVAAIMGPVAIQVALQTDMDPRALGMAVALASSMAFLTPLGHPVNVLVMGPGGYGFADYRRVGLPMAIVLSAVVMLVLPLMFPLRG